jgi:hypothetical protein
MVIRRPTLALILTLWTQPPPPALTQVGPGPSPPARPKPRAGRSHGSMTGGPGPETRVATKRRPAVGPGGWPPVLSLSSTLWKRNPSPNKRGQNGLSLSMLSRRPIQLPPPGRNDCGPGGRRGTIPGPARRVARAAWQACLGGGAGRPLELALTRTPSPDGGYAQPGGLHPPLTQRGSRRGERGPGSLALMGVRLAGCRLVLRPEIRGSRAA